MVTETQGTVEISKAELDELRRQKDELHALKARSDVRCDHDCVHGHKAIVTDAAERDALVKLNAKIDREEKEARLKAEDARLDTLIRAGRIDRATKSKIMAQERDRMGL